MKLFKTLTVFLCLLLLFGACRQAYEQYQTFDRNSWPVSEPLTFTVDVKNKGIYNLYLSLRHTNSFAYSNLWVQLQTIPHNHTEYRERFNFTLADVDGRWEGSSLGDFYDHQYLIRQKMAIDAPGTYIFNLYHDMRNDTLKGIVDAGIKLVRID